MDELLYIYVYLTLFFRMNELGVSLENKNIAFAQLLGMRDHITYPLGMYVTAKEISLCIILLYPLYESIYTGDTMV